MTKLIRGGKRSKNWSGNAKGFALVEFAFILPVLLVLMLGIVEFGLIFFNKAMITNASREGARLGILHREDPATGDPSIVPDSEIIKKVLDYCEDHLVSFGSAEPDVDVDRTGTDPGDELTISVTYEYDFLALPNFVGAFSDALNLHATTVMRME